MKKFNQILLILLTFVLVACGSDSKNIPFDLNIEGIQLDDLSAQQRLLLNQIKKDKTFDPKLLDQLLIEAHVSDYNKRKDTKLTAQELESFLTSVKEKVSLKPEASASERKVAYEAVIGEPILYNRDSVSVGDLWQEKRLQCYSGSIFYHLMAQRLRGRAKDYYTQENPVFVYTPGHIEPGVIADGVLQTIETTAGGAAKVIYGKASELQGCIQVVKAEYFALIEALKADVMIPKSLIREAIEKTAKFYSIDLDGFQCGDTDLDGFFARESKSSFGLLNSGPLGLPGHREVQAGDRARVQFELSDQSGFYRKGNARLVDEWEILNERLQENCSWEMLVDSESMSVGYDVVFSCFASNWPASLAVTKDNFSRVFRDWLVLTFKKFNPGDDDVDIDEEVKEYAKRLAEYTFNDEWELFLKTTQQAGP